MRHFIYGFSVCLMVVGLLLSGCAPKSGQKDISTTLEPLELLPDSLLESPPPDGIWRPHRISWCEGEGKVPKAVEALLGLCSEYFREGSGSDGMLEIEIALEEGQRHPLLLLTLGQLYLIAGQGEPDLLPPEGPAGDVGDWSRNKQRLLSRAESLLREASAGRPMDASIDYLLADVARARNDQAAATELVGVGGQKCTSGRGFAALVLYQQLNNYPGKYLGGPGPEYPLQALKKGITGNVVLDLLISPAGHVRQAVVVESPNMALSRAAATSLKAGSWEPARIGKYPVWSWLRVSTSFSLDQ
jgi:TonB family protein